jgi:hypothetical protein
MQLQCAYLFHERFHMPKLISVLLTFLTNRIFDSLNDAKTRDLGAKSASSSLQHETDWSTDIHVCEDIVKIIRHKNGNGSHVL